MYLPISVGSIVVIVLVLWLIGVVLTLQPGRGKSPIVFTDRKHRYDKHLRGGRCNEWNNRPD